MIDPQIHTSQNFTYATMIHLPDELLLFIISYCNGRTVHALTLTNRRLSSLATPYLYKGYDKSAHIRQDISTPESKFSVLMYLEQVLESHPQTLTVCSNCADPLYTQLR